jgi:hypothetical protein
MSTVKAICSAPVPVGACRTQPEQLIATRLLLEGVASAGFLP